MNRVLVTGAGGFIGRRLCELLRQRDVQVTALHRRLRPGPWQQQLQVDLAADKCTLNLPTAIDTVFHLAGDAHIDDREGSSSRHHAVSVTGTKHLLAALGPHVRHLVYFSSVKAMGESTPPQGVDESGSCQPATAYGRARFEAEELVRVAAAGALRTSVLRLPLVYGPGTRGNLDRMMRAVRARRMPRLPGFGNRRSMIHVDDVCAAALAVVERQPHAACTYLLSDGEDYEPRHVVSLMYMLSGRTPLLPQVPRWGLELAAWVGDCLLAIGLAQVPFSTSTLDKLRGSAVYDASLITRETGFQPTRTLEGALPAMLAALTREGAQ